MKNHLGRFARWKGSPGTLKQLANAGGRCWKDTSDRKRPEWPNDLLTLPGEDWSPPGKRPRNSNKMNTRIKITDNDVNGAPPKIRRSTASGRNGGGNRAVQVVIPRNPGTQREKGDTRDQIFNSKETLFVGTWNVRTMYAVGQLDILLHQIRKLRWSVMGIAETRWTGTGEMNKGDHKIIYTGREDGKHQEGVALIMDKRATRALIGYTTRGSRLIKARFRTAMGKTTIIQVYAPTATSTEEEIEDFYENLQEMIQDIPSQEILIIMGDFNAKVGKDWETWKGALGKFGYGEENERGERLLNFCTSNNLRVMNSAFHQKKDSRKWTWESPDGKTKNRIDYIIVNNRWRSSVTTCRTYSGPDVASDHKLVMAGIRIKLKTARRHGKIRRYDVEKLEDTEMKQRYKEELRRKWTKAKEEEEGAENSVEGTWKEIREIYNETAKQVLGYRETRKKKPWITQEVLNLSDQRKELRRTKTDNEGNRKRYNKLTREIKKKAKKCKEQWIEEKCTEMEHRAERQDTRGLFRMAEEICGTVSSGSSEIRSKDGKKIEDRDEIRGRWREHFEELYNEENPTDITVLEEMPQNSNQDRLGHILRGEIEEAINNQKKRKAPGEDNITAEMIREGEECSVEMMHTLCNRIYQGKKCPEDWGKAIIVPIHKKKDKTICSNYRGISLLSVPGKVYTRVLQQRLRRYVEEIVGEEQAGFRRGRGTVDQIFTIRQLAEKYYEKNKVIYNNFIDFRQAFDSIWQRGLWRVMRNYGIPEELVELLEDLYSKTVSAVRVDGELTEWFRVHVGVRQGCGLSPYLFNLILEAMMDIALADTEIGVRINGTIVNNLRFADDIDLMAESGSQLQELTTRVHESSKRFGLKINGEKTKTMTIGKEKEKINITLEGEELEQVAEFVYLGGVITEDAESTRDIRKRIGLASAMFGKLRKLWRSGNISTRTKTKLYETLVIPVLTYGAESWCMKKEDERRLLVAEMGWLRGLLNRSRREKIRNEVTREELGQKETVVERIKKRRLTWYGHVIRMENGRMPAKALHGEVEGTRSRGRQKKRWIDNVLEDIEDRGWDLRRAIELARDRPKWRSFVRASSSANT